MKLNSLAIKTDLIFAYINGEVLERENYLVVRTPSNPGYHWGNFLVFKMAPQNGDEDRWLEIFKKEFADLPDVKHVAITWDEASPGSSIDRFISKGFLFETNKALATSKVREPQRPNTNIEIRTIESDEQWESAIQNQISANDTYEASSYERFKRGQMANYRKMSEAGLGKWFGAYLGDRIVGDLGVFHKDKVARFQSVVTHPDFRRQGICATLVYESAKYAFSKFNAETLVMVADANYHAAKIYESVGFEAVQTNYALSRWKA